MNVLGNQVIISLSLQFSQHQSPTNKLQSTTSINFIFEYQDSHRQKFVKIVHVVYGTFPPQNMNFQLFLCISLNVLVSFFHYYRNFYKDGKSSPTHSNVHTEMSTTHGKLRNQMWKSFTHNMHYLYIISSMAQHKLHVKFIFKLINVRTFFMRIYIFYLYFQ